MSTGSLPPELLELTFGFCRDLRRLHAAACVCKSWLKAAARCRNALRRLTYNCGYGERGSRPDQFHHADVLCALGTEHHVAVDDRLLVSEEQRLRLVLTHLADDVATEPQLTHSADDVKKWAHLAGGRGSDGPCGMAYDADNSKLYVSDTGIDQVFAVQLNNLGMPVGCTSAKTLRLCDHRCCGPGALCFHQGRLYVACAPRHIVIFSSLPNLGSNDLSARNRIWDQREEADPFGGQPQDLAALDGELFVADTQNHRIVVLCLSLLSSLSGRRQRTLGKQGTAPGEFRKPTAITACRRGADAFLIVGEFTGRRVQILSLFGAPLQLLTLAPAVGPVRVGPFCVQGDRVYATASAPGPPLLVFDLKK